MLDLIGSRNVPKEIDGISLAPTLLGQSQESRPFLYREFPSYGGQQTIRVGQWKAVRQNMSSGNLGIELYDLERDISEKHNVADAHPKVVARLAALMSEQHVPSKIFPLVPIDKPAPKRNR